ncbi:hypothetical protein CENSYa_0697 [Cenarchaeum symbiosum A]|uniref:Uncharacterized protein n=1 Tax=Cenarchaeum symbiosum (strain A) TaxID=414004 RepID=A0RVG3_CENSY|nr:hypothetical protein CENSYa_0697 [Cenarchaeum symbiosum A]
MGKDYRLAHFIKYLESKGLAKFDVLGDSDRALHNYLMIEKRVLFAQQFGLDMHYAFDRYLGGPSSSFAEELYDIAENRSELYDSVDAHVNESFREGEFLELVGGRDAIWLYVASFLY